VLQPGVVTYKNTNLNRMIPFLVKAVDFLSVVLHLFDPNQVDFPLFHFGTGNDDSLYI